MPQDARIVAIIDRLSAKGLVSRRERSEDRRARYADLTPAGERLIDRIFPEHAKNIADVIGVLEPGEQRLATELLKRLGTSAEEGSKDE